MVIDALRLTARAAVFIWSPYEKCERWGDPSGYPKRRYGGVGNMKFWAGEGRNLCLLASWYARNFHAVYGRSFRNFAPTEAFTAHLDAKNQNCEFYDITNTQTFEGLKLKYTHKGYADLLLVLPPMGVTSDRLSTVHCC